jgi:hypothetical protein
VTTSTTTTSGHGESAAEKIQHLLSEVRSAKKVSHHLRSELVRLLNAALRGLGNASGYGHNASLEVLATAFRGDWTWLQQPTAPLATEPIAQISGAKHSAPVQSCRALGEFIQTLEREEHSRKPGISAGLAGSWIQQARAIESSLGCGTAGRGHSSKHHHRHGHSSKHKHHR